MDRLKFLAAAFPCSGAMTAGLVWGLDMPWAKAAVLSFFGFIYISGAVAVGVADAEDEKSLLKSLRRKPE